MNGQAFIKLTSLDFIILNSNPCIDINFYKPVDSLEIIDEQCGFCEFALSSLIIESLEAALNASKSNALPTNQPALKITDELENMQVTSNELRKNLKQKQKENEEMHERLQDKEAKIKRDRDEIDRLRRKLQALDKIIHDG